MKLSIMKIFKLLPVFIFCISNILVTGQTVSFTYGDVTTPDIIKNIEYNNFSVNGNRYFISSFTETMIQKYAVYCYANNGSLNYHKTIELNPGVMGNTFEVTDIIPFANDAWAIVEHLDKGAGKNTLTARKIDPAGNIAATGNDLMVIPFEKTMNAGNNYLSCSPDNNYIGVIGELPFEKEVPCKLKYAVYDKAFKKTWNGEITLPGENTKNKTLEMVMANDGTLYVIKETMSKIGEMELTVYQCTAGATEVKEYELMIDAPNYFTSYKYVVNPANELIVSGTYYKRTTVSTGEPKVNGLFYFTNKGKAQNVMKLVALDAPVENLIAQKIILNDNTIFLATEQYKVETETPASPSASLEYNYKYMHKSDFVIAMDQEGNKKFQIEIAKDFTSRNYDGEYHTSYTICNGKLTLVYNDALKKYVEGHDYGYLALLVQITNDGLMMAPVQFWDTLSINGVMYPCFSVQDKEDQFSLMTLSPDKAKMITIKVSD